jgi:hypothetical protein
MDISTRFAILCRSMFMGWCYAIFLTCLFWICVCAGIWTALAGNFLNAMFCAVGAVSLIYIGQPRPRGRPY